MRWVRYIVNMGKTRTANTTLVGKPQGKRQLGRLRHK
jgi:hypothetical protein